MSGKVSSLKRKNAFNHGDLLVQSYLMDDYNQTGVFNSTRKHRFNRKRCMIYPEDSFKGKWDLFIAL